MPSGATPGVVVQGTTEDLELIPDDEVRPYEFLGKGINGSVLKAIYHKTKELVALKILSQPIEATEVQLLCRLRHENIVRVCCA